jgi:hypothetical protein
MLKLFSVLFISCGFAVSQPISAGLKVGVPLTDALTAVETNSLGYTASTNRYVIGPYIDIHLPASFSVEVDALYRSYDFTQAFVVPTPTGATPVGGSSAASFALTTSVSSWEFPVMLKKKMLSGPIRPYIEGGPVFNHVSVNQVPELIHSSDGGITVGGGVEIHALVVRISPEVRYEGFLLRNFSSDGVLQSNRNQVLFMVGIGF